jgi:hypothetical protein
VASVDFIIGSKQQRVRADQHRVLGLDSHDIGIKQPSAGNVSHEEKNVATFP